MSTWCLIQSRKLGISPNFGKWARGRSSRDGEDDAEVFHRSSDPATLCMARRGCRTAVSAGITDIGCKAEFEFSRLHPRVLPFPYFGNDRCCCERRTSHEEEHVVLGISVGRDFTLVGGYVAGSAFSSKFSGEFPVAGSIAGRRDFSHVVIF